MRRVFLAFALACACGGSNAATQPDPGVGAPARVPAITREETALMEKLRETVQSKPQAAVTLADEGERRFPASPLREEREALAIRGLVNLQRIGAARDRAEIFLRRYPNGPYATSIANLTGVHVTPDAPHPK